MASDVKLLVSLRNVVKLTNTLHYIGPQRFQHTCICVYDYLQVYRSVSTQTDRIPCDFVSKSKEIVFQFSLLKLSQ
jgi:hypothetical protein